MFLSMVRFLHLFAAFTIDRVVIDLHIVKPGFIHFLVTFVVSILHSFYAFTCLAGMPRRIRIILTIMNLYNGVESFGTVYYIVSVGLFVLTFHCIYIQLIAILH